MKVGEWSDQWLRLHPRPAATTEKHLGYMTRAFVAEFSDRPLDSISVLEARKWALDNPQSYRFVRTMFEDARRDDLVPANPFANLRIPQSQGRQELNVISETQVVMLSKAVADEAGLLLRSAFHLTVRSGIRLGEMLALTYGDLDLEGRRMWIEKSLRPDGSVAPTKTKRSWLAIIPTCAVDELYIGNVLTADPTDRVFSFSRRWHGKKWLKARRSIDVDVAWHELRHKAATWMLEHGASTQQVAFQFGHKNDKLIRELYGHPDREAELDALDAVLTTERREAA